MLQIWKDTLIQSGSATILLYSKKRIRKRCGCLAEGRCIYRRSGNFRVKNNSREKFSKFSRFRSIREIFLTVDDSSMDERLENSWRLVYFQVPGEPRIAGCSRRSDIHLGECGLARASLFTDHRRVIIFRVLRWHGHLSAKVTKNANLGYSHDQGLS